MQPVRDRYLGRKDGLDHANAEGARRGRRPRSAGSAVPAPIDFKAYVEQQLDEAAEAVRAAAERAALERASLDVTLPGRQPRLGHRHPLTLVRDRMEAIFTRMGFAIVEGPEIEDEWHCFDALNMPAEHPARDMQDTLYLAKPVKGDSGRADDVRTLLRTHTSSMQIRYMETHQPPIRIVVPGRVYRRDDLDLTHSPAFGQVEALVVGAGHLDGAPQGHAARLRPRDVFGDRARAVPSELFSVHRAERRNRHQLLAVRRRRLSDVQENRLDRARRLRHGASGGVRSGRLRPGAASPVLPGDWGSSASRC